MTIKTMDREEIEQLYDWNYVESEGPDVTRFDFTARNEPCSLWVYWANNTIEGTVPESVLNALTQQNFIKENYAETV